MAMLVPALMPLYVAHSVDTDAGDGDGDGGIDGDASGAGSDSNTDARNPGTSIAINDESDEKCTYM